jgi:Tfp pilus assembly protein PilZ
VRHAVEFVVGEGRREPGVCRNLGLGGVAIQTAEPAAFGSRVVVYMELDGIDGETPLGGTVRWSKPGVMGVQWDSLGVRVTHAILRTAALRE